MIIQDFLSKFNGVKKTGKDRWMACCPAHDDRTASLSICIVEDGKILCHCFAECDIGQILDAVGLSVCDLFEKRFPDSKGKLLNLPLHEVLSIIDREVTIVAVCGSRLLNGELSAADRERLFTAVGRIKYALDRAGVQNG